jgi:hypothetical protein
MREIERVHAADHSTHLKEVASILAGVQAPGHVLGGSPSSILSLPAMYIALPNKPVALPGAGTGKTYTNTSGITIVLATLFAHRL